jgi:hypothetical protein
MTPATKYQHSLPGPLADEQAVVNAPAAGSTPTVPVPAEFCPFAAATTPLQLGSMSSDTPSLPLDSIASPSDMMAQSEVQVIVPVFCGSIQASIVTESPSPAVSAEAAEYANAVDPSKLIPPFAKLQSSGPGV